MEKIIWRLYRHGPSGDIYVVGITYDGYWREIVGPLQHSEHEAALKGVCEGHGNPEDIEWAETQNWTRVI